MKLVVTAALVGSFVPVLATAEVPAAQAVPCPAPGEYIDQHAVVTVPTLVSSPITVNHDDDYLVTSLVTTGDEIGGPARVVLLYLNRLRYSFGATIDVTIIQNPALPAGLVNTSLAAGVPTPPSVPRGGPTPGGPGVAGVFDDKFDAIRDCIQDYANRTTQIEQDRQARTSSVQNATKAYEEVLVSMPSMLSRTQAEELQRRAAALSGTGSLLRQALERPFPADHARVVHNAIVAFTTIAAGIEATDEYKAWVKTGENHARYLAEKAKLLQVQARLDPILSGQPAETAFVALQNKVAFWLARFVAFAGMKIGAPVLGPDDQPLARVTSEDLALALDANCRTIFGRGKTSPVTYSVTDLFGSDSQTAARAVSVTCLPVLAISAGIGISNLGDQTPAFVPSKGSAPGTVATKFGFSERSAVKPLFMVQTNVRLTNNRDVNLFGTLGVGAVSRTESATVEFVMGPTVGFKNVFFVTAGLHFGKQARIGGGFEEDDEKPAGLDAVPLDNGLRPGLALTLTFPLNR